MTKILFIVALIGLSACQTNPSTDPNELTFSVPIGSSLILNETLQIEHLYTHALLQNGKQISQKENDDYQINCSLEFKKFGPSSIEPQIFNVTKRFDSQDLVSTSNIYRYSTELFLSSKQGTDIIKLVCQQYGDGADRNFTVAEMQAALEPIMSIEFLDIKIKK